MIISPAITLPQPQLASYTSSGSYAYTIPSWCSHIDVIVLGGGGGGREGDGGNNAVGNGGSAGSWNMRTLERGLDIPWGTTTITGTVGAGGVAGAKGGGDVPATSKGGDTSAVYAGITLNGVGGAGGTGTGGVAGGSPNSITANSNIYTGGATAPSGASRTVGNAPGGGGGGGAGGLFNGQTAGMAGATGAVYFYAHTRGYPPRAQSSDTLDTLTSYTVDSTGSGIAASGGEAIWNGTTDGNSVALYNVTASTNNQYVVGTVGSIVTGNGSGLILHCDVGYTGYYAAMFFSGGIKLLRSAGRWGTSGVEIANFSITINSGDQIEFWNIGEVFRIAINGTLRIEQTVSGAIIDEYHRYQGFGMYRAAFLSSTRITGWSGGDAIAYGKT